MTAARPASASPTVRIRVWAKPGSRRAEIGWDAWRKRWAVAVVQLPSAGRANDAILAALARQLGVAPAAIRWRHAGSGHAKEAEVDGLAAAEVERRLRGGTGQADGPA